MSVASKNLYDLLGNDEEGSETPVAPVKTVTKTSTKTGKANADGTGPATAAGARSEARGGFSARERDFRNEGVGRSANRSKPTDEAPRTGARGGRGARGRGGRGATHHRNADDRHTKNIVPGSEKQAAQSWGAAEGTAELNDEQAGEAIARAEQKDAEAEDAEAEAQEPEVKTMSLDAFLAQQAESRAALNAPISTRKINEGVSAKLINNTKELKKEDEEAYIAGSDPKDKKGGKAQKAGKTIIPWGERAADASKNTHESRGGFRGRGDRGDRRGGGGRGAPRAGGAPRGGDGFPRGGPRGGRGGSAPFNATNADDFPTLGGGK